MAARGEQPTLAPAVTTNTAATGTSMASPASTDAPDSMLLLKGLPTVATTPTPFDITPEQPILTELTLEERQLMFREVWQIVNENYVYPDFRGLDWNAVWVEFAPRVNATRTDEELYTLLSEMVERLNDHHSRFLAPSAAVAEKALSIGHESHVGIGVVTIPAGDGAIIQQVFADSPAARAGLRPRDRIVQVNGEPFLTGRDIVGEEGTLVSLSIMRPDAGEQLHEVVLTRQSVVGRIEPTVRRLDGDIGYIAIPTLWVHDMNDQVSGALTDLVVERPLRGVIIDLRGNPGGWRDVLTGTLGHFVRGNVGSFYDRQGTRALIIRQGSGPDLRGMPLVVLVDRATASYAEVLAGVLQTEANAHVIGVPSAGNTETIYAYELAGGARLWVAQEGFRLLNGSNLEGQGVQPDKLIDEDWVQYSEARDPHILAALHYFGVGRKLNDGGE
ncbi:MAG: PDZ domain-containing protein [Chloroflexaceae bacterium]|nr:PDZ domain-containing protein [Chloroflexaceae bacterium]